jgi:nucleotide-binding universal stress UspA family protein
MYNNILAPLDGSDLSECSLPHVSAIAHGCGVSNVTLLRVIEPFSAAEIAAFSEAGGDLLTQAEKEEETEARLYLDKLSSKLRAEGIAATTIIINGRAADMIMDYATKHQTDLIIMTTHGRSGMSRWFFGSVADKIVRQSSIPVLIISPPGCRLEQPS